VDTLIQDIGIGNPEFWANVELVRGLEKTLMEQVSQFKKSVYDLGLRKILDDTILREMNFALGDTNLNCWTEHGHTRFTFKRENSYLELIGFENADDPCFSIEDFEGSDKDLVYILDRAVKNWGMMKYIGS
jgi:hypothetical protein